jgi:hypothetical protein
MVILQLEEFLAKQLYDFEMKKRHDLIERKKRTHDLIGMNVVEFDLFVEFYSLFVE